MRTAQEIRIDIYNKICVDMSADCYSIYFNIAVDKLVKAYQEIDSLKEENKSK